MNIDKAKSLLNKIEFLLKNLEDDRDQYNKLERELLLNYTQQLKDILLESKSVEEKAESKVEKPMEYKPLVEEPVTPVKQEVKQESIAAPIKEPKPVELPAIEKKEFAKEIAAKAIPVKEEIKAKLEEEVPAKVQGITVSDSGISKFKEIFDLEDENDISGKLSARPIADLTKSMGLNEKIFTVKELFGNDNGLFSETMSKLNDLSSFEEAKSYLANEIAEKYDWVSDEKKKKAMKFIRLVKRRYN